MELPRALVRAVAAGGDPGRAAWLEALPGVVDGLAARWSLALGPPLQPGGHTAWVAPAGGDLLQHLLNEPRRMTTDPRGTVRRLADLTGLDRDRALLWAFARAVVGSAWSPWARPVATALAP